MNDEALEVFSENERAAWATHLKAIREAKSLENIPSRHAFFQALSTIVPNILTKETRVSLGMAFNNGDQIERLGGVIARSSEKEYISISILPAAPVTVNDEIRFIRNTQNQSLTLSLFLNRDTGAFAYATTSSTAENMTAHIDRLGNLSLNGKPRDERIENIGGMIVFMVDEGSIDTLKLTTDVLQAGL